MWALCVFPALECGLAAFTMKQMLTLVAGAWEADVPAVACLEIVAGKRDHEIGKMLEVNGTVPW
jgi:hypothetical protein